MRSTTRGFTLVELVVAIVIIASAGGTLIAMLAANSKASAELMAQSQCANIAQSYLNEILATPFDDADGLPDAPGRASFDNVDDYAGLVDVGPVDRFGNAMANLADYTVSVTVAQPAASLDVVATAETRLVQVDVDYMSNDCVLLSGFRTRHP